MSDYNTTYQPRRKAARELWIAYVLWFFLGQIGIHKFYLEQKGTGIIYLITAVIGYTLTAILIGYLILIPLWIALIIDLFTIPGRVNDLNVLPEYNAGF